MRFRHRVREPGKIELQMTPMIDVVFQLLVFFLFTLKFVPVEGEIAVEMPPITSGSAPDSDELDLTERVRIRLTAAPNGQLAGIRLGENQLGADPAALTDELRSAFAGPAGMADGVEVEIDADRNLKYRYVVRGTNAVMRAGIEKIDFTDPMLRPQGAR